MDEKGEAMSKSKGNVVYPGPIVEEYGADALRLAGATDARLGSDIRFSRERVQAASRFIQKLWSISRFVSFFPHVAEKPELFEADKWILSELDKLIEDVRRLYDDFDFFAAQYVINFVWDIFADHYIELVKGRAWDGEDKEKKAAWWTLHHVLQSVLKMLAPVIPFVTDYIYRELYGRTVHLEAFPESSGEFKEYLSLTKIIREVNSAIWKTKRSKGLSLKSTLKTLYLPKELSGLESDLKRMHHAEKIVFGEIGGEIVETESGLKIGIEL